MGTDPIPALIARFALPATLGVVANALYNIVDRVFIGRAVGPAGLAAISIVFPLVLAVVALSALFGVGTASQISRFLGTGDREGAERALGSGLSCASLFLAVALPPLLLTLPQAALLFGARGDVVPLTEEYLRITSPAIPAPFLTMMLMGSLRAEGRPRPAMWAMVLGAGLNVMLDWLFIVIWNMGVAGAAWGTALSQLFALAWVLGVYLLRQSELRLSLRCLRPRPAHVREMLGIGMSPFLLNIFFSVMMALFNVLLGLHGGELAVSAMGIFFGIDSLLFMPVTGVGEGAMPVVGYNYGARSFSRARQAVRLALAVSIAWYAVSEVVALVWPEALASFFTTDAELLRRAARSMRIGYAALPCGAVAMIGCYVLEALGRAKTSFTFNVFRQSISIALLFVLPRFWGADGVWLTLPAADVLGGLSMAWLLRREIKSWPDDRK